MIKFKKKEVIKEEGKMVENVDSEIQKSNDYPITKKDYEKTFKERGLSNKWDFFKEHLKPEIWIKLTESTEDKIKIGQSKIGGHPDLPQKLHWPKEKNGKYFLFVAQINCEDLNNNEIQNIPNKGIIYFFFSENYTSNRTIFIEDLSSLERKEAPNTISLSNSTSFNANLNDGVYNSCTVEFKNTYGLPSWEYEFVSKQLNESQEVSYSEIPRYSNYITKLFGHSNCIQSPMEYSCEMISRGYTWPNHIVSDEKIIQEMKDNQYQWKLLFQIDSEKLTKMMWGDVGRLYFWIKEKDLKAQNFDNVVAITQGG
ncbi:YwqG family protein [Tenacibaculum ovolyticum]|uniref:YwqG family protein n=1 Tax=Tenacibaculum ovolyticum TaxID=104270 RepID=UPI001F44E247|nr:YwqG family protein [Tenacibaculum ovolyticum]